MDNRWYFSVFIPSKIRVLILGSRRQNLLPIHLALAPKENPTNFEIHESLFDENWTDRLAQADVAFINGCPAFTEFEIRTLKHFVDRGGGLILIPGSDTNLRQLNEQFFIAVHLVMGNLNRSEISESHRSFGRIDFSHPLYDQIFEKSREQLRSPEFSQSIDIVDPGDSQILMRFKDGNPFLMILPRDRGNLIVLTSGIAPPWSDFQTAPFFAPFIHRLAIFATKTNERGESQICGQPFQISIEPVSGKASRYMAQLPSGEERDVLPEMAGQQLQLKLKSTNMPGNYRFFQDDSLLALKAFNMDTAESDFTPINPDEIKKIFTNVPISMISEKGSLNTTIRQARWGREIGWEMLAIALILLLMEMGIAKWFKAEGKGL